MVVNFQAGDSVCFVNGLNPQTVGFDDGDFEWLEDFLPFIGSVGEAIQVFANEVSGPYMVSVLWENAPTGPDGEENMQLYYPVEYLQLVAPGEPEVFEKTWK